MKGNKLDKASIIAIKDCMGAKKGEKILVITDEQKNEIGYSLYKNALKLGFETLYIEMKSGKTNGEEPPIYIAEMMKYFDIVLCPTSKSLTHTKARREASAAGARIATFPGITKEVMIRGLNADYSKISELTLKLKSIMENVKKVRVVTEKGTDIEMKIEGRGIYASKGLFLVKGESGNLPTGETFCAPVEGSANGIFVVDGSMAGIGKINDEPIKIIVKNGYAVKISGGKAAGKLKKILSQFGADGKNIAEFGIGTNYAAKLSGVLLEDEKVLGTIHIALGNNKSMGGNIDVPIHLDGVVKYPDVFFDEEIIMEKGHLLI
ncbi:MAG: aminopeptidase [Ignavibacteria bacterium]|nr:aminopeptidase [Ignavibacteria bacterium]